MEVVMDSIFCRSSGEVGQRDDRTDQQHEKVTVSFYRALEAAQLELETSGQKHRPVASAFDPVRRIGFAMALRMEADDRELCRLTPFRKNAETGRIGR
jgi:hypothetical protein